MNIFNKIILFIVPLVMCICLGIMLYSRFIDAHYFGDNIIKIVKFAPFLVFGVIYNVIDEKDEKQKKIMKIYKIFLSSFFLTYLVLFKSI